jgi:hypothetical protein
LRTPYFIIALIIVFGCSLSVYASTVTGQQLLAKLTSSDARERVPAMILIGDILFQWNGKSHCKPPGVTVGQATAIVEKYLKEFPEVWDGEASHVIGAIFGMMWPCQSQQKGR